MSHLLLALAFVWQLPTADQVLDRYVRVTGGQLVMFMKGGKLTQTITYPNGRVMRGGYDGRVAWSMDTSGKVHLAKSDVIKTVARDADMYYHLHVMRYFRSPAVVDVQPFGGQSCYHLKGVNNWGQPNEQFYDTATGLLIGYHYNTAWRGGKGDATTTFEAYRNFGGVLMPTTVTSRDGDDVSVDHLASVTYDDVDDRVFAVP